MDRKSTKLIGLALMVMLGVEITVFGGLPLWAAVNKSRDGPHRKL